MSSDVEDQTSSRARSSAPAANLCARVRKSFVLGLKGHADYDQPARRTCATEFEERRGMPLGSDF
jgi:hypothetical protein